MRSALKKTFLGLVIIFVSGCLLGAFAKKSWDAHFYDDYDANAALNPHVRGEEDREGYHRIDLTFDGVPGAPVPTLIALPDSVSPPYPCIIFLHGIGQKKDFLDDIVPPFMKAGYAMASFDQYTRGERRLQDANFVEETLAFRRRAALTVIETRRLVDYLQTREDIAKDRIYLIGASYGAVTGSTALAFEPRLRAGVMTYGGGNIDLLLDSDAAKNELGSLRWPVAKLVQFLLAPSDPIRYVAQVSPRPILFQSGEHDTVVPVKAGRALYEAAMEPKELVIYDSDHIGMDEAHVWKVLNDSIDWLNKIDRGNADLAKHDAPHPEHG